MYVAILHVFVCFLSLVQYNFQLSLGDAGERMFVVVREFSSDLQWRRSNKSTIVKWRSSLAFQTYSEVSAVTLQLPISSSQHWSTAVPAASTPATTRLQSFSKDWTLCRASSRWVLSSSWSAYRNTYTAELTFGLFTNLSIFMLLSSMLWAMAALCFGRFVLSVHLCRQRRSMLACCQLSVLCLNYTVFYCGEKLIGYFFSALMMLFRTCWM